MYGNMAILRYNVQSTIFFSYEQKPLFHLYSFTSEAAVLVVFLHNTTIPLAPQADRLKCLQTTRSLFYGLLSCVTKCFQQCSNPERSIILFKVACRRDFQERVGE